MEAGSSGGMGHEVYGPSSGSEPVSSGLGRYLDLGAVLTQSHSCLKTGLPEVFHCAKSSFSCGQ